MTVAAAFEILELRDGATLEDVSVSFRRLLKIYHPDRNVDRSEWSHEQTVRLNEAYEAAVEFLRSRGVTPPSRAEADREREERDRAAAEHARSSSHQDVDPRYSIGLQLQLAQRYDLLLDQVFAYYSFGLQKVHLRGEGTFRYRYRMTVKQMESVVRAFRELKEWPGSELQHSHVDTVHAFAAAFHENMLIKPFPHRVYSGDDHKANQLYRQGSEALDEAIKAGLFGAELGATVSSPSACTTSERAFMLALAHYPRSPFTAETLIKFYLLEAYARLYRIIEAG